MYDILIVGAGLSAATLCAKLKKNHKILVIDNRNHLGGNCYDYKSNDIYIHRYGPHIFHSPNKSIVDFLSQYTDWMKYKYSVTGEIYYNQKILRVPFPYCKATEQALNKKLSSEEVLELFFKHYSKKMWGKPYHNLPESIKKRVPKDTKDFPDYFPGQFPGIPKSGYTHMMENMFDGVEIVLGIDTNDWYKIPAKHIIYCGRIDHVKYIDSKKTYGDIYGYLPHRSLKISFAQENWDADTTSVNFCHKKTRFTRKVNHSYFSSPKKYSTISYETPHQALKLDASPFYPIPFKKNNEKYMKIKSQLTKDYPNLILCGRLARYQYFDMYQTVGNALSVARQFSSALKNE